MELSEIVARYGTPDPALVQQRDNGKGNMLSYVGHGEVTKMLIEIDPMWDWQPAAWIEGKPAIHRHHAKFVFRNGDVKETEIATMWGFMTVLGKTLPCVGSAPADKEDVEKELIGDLIRNGALRFGICINLWAKSLSSESSYSSPAPRNSNSEVAPAQAGGPKTIVNKMKGTCIHCAGKVEVGEGEAFTSGDGKWKTRHAAGQCPVEDAF